ncbi:hypothetical protein L1887_31526 [Cichorium endivia]|nr:hypothetical protein L1887_31526 [Cichorium endivia]
MFALVSNGRFSSFLVVVYSFFSHPATNPTSAIINAFCSNSPRIRLRITHTVFTLNSSSFLMFIVDRRFLYEELCRKL